MKRYTVFALCRKEGALGEFTRMDFRVSLEAEQHAVFGSTLVTQAISALRRMGYETHHIETIEETGL